ncbi:transmembrane protein, putative (macronuclear) [Tetrahymena thermophila SB210]|uniref:Transmembrane protein, putative n=1 Tax=Tetrahymena thermophila (strain SB210) TaxID=312017 RepID=W7XAL0_TETTS|nr:transmembrane protein, putative [Tetrahymena thermophila SB210]EWS74367.1 transmembrane protein, putative [Tetrahymena thermophila SB210]|eukprot:XP_012653096.1 transmembrane protein, putative [Tetrahymena thermophila SB210]
MNQIKKDKKKHKQLQQKKKSKQSKIQKNKIKVLYCFKLNFFSKNTTVQNNQTVFLKYKFQKEKINKKWIINLKNLIQNKLKQLKNISKQNLLIQTIISFRKKLFNKLKVKYVENIIYINHIYKLNILQINMENLMRLMLRIQKLLKLVKINLKYIDKKINNYFFQFIIIYNLLYHLFFFFQKY